MHQEYTSSQETFAISAIGPPVCNQRDEHKLLVQSVGEMVGGGWIVCRNIEPDLIEALLFCAR